MNVPEAETSARMKWVAAFIPVVCVALLMVRGEVRSAASKKFLIPITGYDPRDLLHGQYIRFRFKWGVEAPTSSCEGPRCCLCLRGDEMTRPEVEYVGCEAPPDTCGAVLSGVEATRRQRYLVPEHAGHALEAELRDRDASVEVQCSGDGSFALGELYLDGQPWREIVYPALQFH